MRLRWIVLLLVAAVAAWMAWEWFRPVNRVQRATYRLLEVMPKEQPGPDAPLTLFKVQGTCRDALAPDALAIVAMNPQPYRVRGRNEILEHLQFIRQALDNLWLDHPQVAATPLPGGSIEVHVEVPFKAQLERSARSLMEGRRWDYDLHARLLWTQTPDGWRISTAEIAPFRGEPLSSPAGE